MAKLPRDTIAHYEYDGKGNINITITDLIRCKDCEHWDTTWQNDFAPNYHYCPLIDGTRRDDFYCADAELRGDSDDN